MIYKVLPLKEYAQTPIWWEESPLDKVELVEVFKQEGDPVSVSGWGPHGLSDVHELGHGVVILFRLL